MILVIEYKLPNSSCYFLVAAEWFLRYCTKKDIFFAAKLRYTLQNSQNNTQIRYSTEHSL